MQTDAAPPTRAWLAPLAGLAAMLIGIGASGLIGWQLSGLTVAAPAAPAMLEAPALRATAATADARARLP